MSKRRREASEREREREREREKRDVAGREEGKEWRNKTTDPKGTGRCCVNQYCAYLCLASCSLLADP
jgi:hypothetical protein